MYLCKTQERNVMRLTEHGNWLTNSEHLASDWVKCGDITALEWDSIIKCGVFSSSYVNYIFSSYYFYTPISLALIWTVKKKSAARASNAGW